MLVTYNIPVKDIIYGIRYNIPVYRPQNEVNSVTDQWLDSDLIPKFTKNFEFSQNSSKLKGKRVKNRK